VAGTPEQIRAEAVEELTGPGRQRLELARQMSQVDETLRPIVRKALGAGVPATRIRELTGLARGTIRAWSAEG
jgi:hypothetical protein